MIIRYNTCENMRDKDNNTPRKFYYLWKRIHLGLIRIWLGYEIYNLIDNNTKLLVKHSKGGNVVGRHLHIIEIKWGWK